MEQFIIEASRVKHLLPLRPVQISAESAIRFAVNPHSGDLKLTAFVGIWIPCSSTTKNKLQIREVVQIHNKKIQKVYRYDTCWAYPSTASISEFNSGPNSNRIKCVPYQETSDKPMARSKMWHLQFLVGSVGGSPLFLSHPLLVHRGTSLRHKFGLKDVCSLHSRIWHDLYWRWQEY